MDLFSILLFIINLSSPTDFVHSTSFEYLPGYFDITTAVAISPAHAVTTAVCTDPADISVTINGEQVFPASIISGGDIGLSILIFDNPVFSDYQSPEYSELMEGEILRIIGQGINGIVIIEETAGRTNPDGSVTINTPLSDGFMGAAVFDQNEIFVGVISGLEFSSDRRVSQFYFSEPPSYNLVLYSTSIWYMWAQLIVNPPESTDFRFGVTAMANTTGGSSNSPTGIQLLSVEEGGIAWNCGLRPGNIITELNGQPAYHPYTLRGLLLMSEDTIDAVLWDGDDVRILKIPPASDIY